MTTDVTDGVRVYGAKVWTEYTVQKFGQNIWGKSLDRVYRVKRSDRVYRVVFGMAGHGQSEHIRNA